MNTFRKYYIIFALLAFLLATRILASDLVLLATTDIHGSIFSDKGGFLRLSSVIKEQKNQNEEDKVLLIDCGDTLQGSFEAAHTKGELPLKILNFLSYDFWIPGNHDFDYGFDVFLKRASEFKGITLCSNLIANPSQTPYISCYITTKNKIKIAIIGITFPSINSDFKIPLDAPFRSISISSALKKTMPDVLKAKPDIIILALHGGLYNRDWNLISEIKNFPQIDIILGGHTHEAKIGQRLYNGAYYLQTGHGGEFLGRINMTRNKKTGIFEFNSRIINTSSYQIDNELEAKLLPDLSQTEKQGNKIIADFNDKKSQECGFLISDAMKDFAKSDAAIFGLSRKTNKITGKLTLRQIFDYVPHEDLISTMLVTKTELKLIIEDIYRHKKKNTKYKKIYWSGFKCKLSTQGKVLNLTLPNKLAAKDKIKIAIPSYYIEYPTVKFPYIKQFASQNNSEYKNLNKNVREVFISYLEKNFPQKN